MARNRRNSGNGDDGSKFLDSILTKLLSRLALSLVVIVVFLTLVQCTIKKPESPQWTTNFVVPVVNKTYDMEELISRLDQDGIEMDSLGNITYTISEELDTITVGSDNLTTPDINYSFGRTLDTVSISTPTIPPATVTFADITGISSSTPEDTVTIAPQSFDINQALPAATSYTSATCFSGTANFNLVNNLGASLDTVILQLWDIPLNNLLAVDSIYTIVPSGTTISLPIDLAGRTISNQFRVIAHCHTTGGFVTQVSTRSMSGEIDFVGSVIVTSAVAQIPATSRSFSDKVDLIETDHLDTARIASGNLAISITNQTNLNVSVQITIPDIYSGSSPLVLNPNVLARQTANLSFDLSGYDVIPSDQTIPQALNIDAVVNVPSSAPAHISVVQSDSFYITAALSSLTFSSVSGYFTDVQASFNGISESIDIPTGFDSVSLTSAVLTLDINNGIDLPGQLDIQVDGNNGKTLNLLGNIFASGGLVSAVSTIIEPSAGNFLTPLPSLFDVSGNVTFANGGYQGRIEADDFISATVTLVSPLEMIIQPSSVNTDVEKTDIDQEDVDIVTDHVEEARFIYSIISHLPTGAQVELFFGPDSATLFTNPQLQISSLSLPAAPFDIAGLVTDTVSLNDQEIYLNSIDIKILENDTLYYASTLNLAGTGGQIIKVTGNDYLTITGRIEVAYRFDGDI